MSSPKWWRDMDEITVKFTAREQVMMKALIRYYKKGPQQLVKDFLIPQIVEKYKDLEIKGLLIKGDN